MSPNDSLNDLDKILPLSSLSSDSESLFEVGVKNSENQIDDEWDVIERTLYQEPGSQVTDQELLKECKLWRDTFPHLRVTGTKIDVHKADIFETDQSVHTVNSHFDLKKLDEKRQSIKKRVIGELVERLIAKFSLNKEAEEQKSTVQITEIDDADLGNNSPKMLNSFVPEKKIDRELRRNVLHATINTEKESYFERGKLKTNAGLDVGLTKEQAEKGLLEIFNNLDKSRDFKDYKNFPELPKGNEGKLEFLEKHYLDLKGSDKLAHERSKPKKNTVPSDSLTNMFKPFKMVSKIDKKYESLLGKIMEQKHKPDRLKHCRTSSSGYEIKSCQDSLEKLRIESGFHYTKNLPKINKFNNNWLNRAETNNYDEMEGVSLGRTNSIKNKKLSKKLDLFRQDRSEVDIDDFIENVRKEMVSNYKRQPNRSGLMEGINLRRPKPFKPDEKVERSVKSWSCGDLPKKGKKDAKSRQMKSGFEKPKELNFKSRSKLTNLNNCRGTKVSENKKTVLPPIESGIICTELTGRPKIRPKMNSKRF